MNPETRFLVDVYCSKQRFIVETGFLCVSPDINKLVDFEMYENPSEAIAREKQIKAGSRQKKINLINSINLEWKDLYPGIV